MSKRRTTHRDLPAPEAMEPIPPIPKELVVPIRCLVLAAREYRAAAESAIAKIAKAESIPPEIREQLRDLGMVTDAWINHPDLGVEDEEMDQI